MTPKNLARLMKVADQDALRRQYLADEIFAGDAEAFTAMNNASNGFEHGYMALDEVRGLLAPVLERSMGHVCAALIAASGVASETQARLLAGTYAEPRGLVPMIAVVTGELRRNDPAQAPPVDGAMAQLEWKSASPVATHAPGGEVVISFPWEIKVAGLSPNTTLDVTGYGMRAAHVRPADEPVDVEVLRAQDARTQPH